MKEKYEATIQEIDKMQLSLQKISKDFLTLVNDVKKDRLDDYCNFTIQQQLFNINNSLCNIDRQLNYTMYFNRYSKIKKKKMKDILD